MNLEIVTTADGLNSLYVPELQEHYHSVHGALQEAEHVFVHAGFDYAAKHFEKVMLLEVGFGTGLNFYLTWLAASGLQKRLNYHGVELYPISEQIASRLNYGEVIGGRATKEEFMAVHRLPWETLHSLDDMVQLTKHHSSVFDFETADRFNLVYFDAFGFRAQEEMWSTEVFLKLYRLLVPGGVLVTYASKGEVRRRMQQAGFSVQKLRGPQGKREMVRAIKE